MWTGVYNYWERKWIELESVRLYEIIQRWSGLIAIESMSFIRALYLWAFIIQKKTQNCTFGESCFNMKYSAFS